MKHFWKIWLMWFVGCVCGLAQPTGEAGWEAKRVHYAFPGKAPYDAWIIKPTDDAAAPASNFEVIIDKIYREDRNSVIAHIWLCDAHRSGPLQDEVIQQLTGTVVLKKYPTRHGSDGRMYLDGTPNPLSQTMRQLVYAAILNTSTVKEMDRILGKHGLRIESVSSEKLFIASEKGRFWWDGMGWLIVGKADPGVVPQSCPPVGHSEDAR